jgi:hypothetical protein
MAYDAMLTLHLKDATRMHHVILDLQYNLVLLLQDNLVFWLFGIVRDTDLGPLSLIFGTYF